MLPLNGTYTWSVADFWKYCHTMTPANTAMMTTARASNRMKDFCKILCCPLCLFFTVSVITVIGSQLVKRKIYTVCMYVCVLCMHVESMKDFCSENAADRSASFTLHVSIKNHKGRKVGRKKMYKCTCSYIGARVYEVGV